MSKPSLFDDDAPAQGGGKRSLFDDMPDDDPRVSALSGPGAKDPDAPAPLDYPTSTTISGPSARLRPATPKNTIGETHELDPTAQEVVKAVAAGPVAELAAEAAPAVAAGVSKLAGPVARTALKAAHLVHAPVSGAMHLLSKLGSAAPAAAEVATRAAAPMSAAAARAAIDAATAGGATVGQAAMQLIKEGVPQAAVFAGARAAMGGTPDVPAK